MARIIARGVYAAAFLSLAVAYYYFLGAGPTPSERAEELRWWRPLGWALQVEWEPLAPLQEIGAEVVQARHEGRTEPRGLIPLSLFALPPILLAVLGFVLFRSAGARALVLAGGLLLCAFSYYGWLSSETWQDYSWRWPAVLLVTSLYLAVFVLAPQFVREARSWPRSLRLAAALGFVVSIYILSIEITGSNPRLPWNLSPWPVVTLYGFLFCGLVLGVVHLAVGVGVVAGRRARAPLDGILGALIAAVVAGLLHGIPFAHAGVAQVALLATPAALIAALAIGRREQGTPGVFFLVAGLLILASIKAGQWQGEYFQVKARDEISPLVVEAIEAYREDHDSYPDELLELVPGYLSEVPLPRIGWFAGRDEAFVYTNLGSSFLLEFSSVLWVQCAYSPPYLDVAGSEEDDDPFRASPPPHEAAGREVVERLGASWSCERRPPRLW